MKKLITLVSSFLLFSLSSFSQAEVLEEVTITSIRDSAAAAVEQQKNADGVTNVVAGDTVGKLPDSNIAEHYNVFQVFQFNATKAKVVISTFVVLQVSSQTSQSMV